MSAAISLDTPKNRLLAALPAEVYQRLLPQSGSGRSPAGAGYSWL